MISEYRYHVCTSYTRVLAHEYLCIVQARKRIVQDVIAMKNREACTDIPVASSLTRRETSTSEFDIYCSDDDLGSSELP